MLYIWANQDTSECLSVDELHFPDWTMFCVPIFKLVLDFLLFTFYWVLFTFTLLLRCSWHITVYKFMVYNTMIWSIVPDVYCLLPFFPLWSKTCQFPFSLTISLMPQFSSSSLQPMTPIFFFSIFHFHSLPLSQSEDENVFVWEMS